MLKTVLMASLLTLTACSTVTDVFTKPSPSFLKASEGEEQLNSTESCCSDGDILSGKMTNVTSASEEKYFIDADNERAYNFPTGKSFFKVFQLPLNVSYLQINISATIINTVFVPRVDFYNSKKQLVSTLKPSAFRYRDSLIGDGNLSGKIAINNAGAAPGHEFAYMVVYTTDAEKKQTTSVINPEVKRAISLNLKRPDLPNVEIPHSAIGELEIEFKFRKTEDDLTNDIISYLDQPIFGGEGKSNREENVVLANGKVYSISSQSEGSTAVTSLNGQGEEVINARSGVANTQMSEVANNAAPVGSMMKETEELYNRLIREAVKGGDLTKAMNLVGEAQRAGSGSAQNAFIDAVQSVKK